MKEYLKTGTMKQIADGASEAGHIIIESENNPEGNTQAQMTDFWKEAMKLLEVNLDKTNRIPELTDGHEDGLWCVVLTGKATISTSNSVIIKSPHHIVLIDPGRSEKQADYLERFIMRYRQPDSPVFLMMTHCHLDHGANLFKLLERKELNVKVIMNRTCSEVFEGKKDRAVLLEDFFDTTIPPYTPDIIVTDSPNDPSASIPSGLEVTWKSSPSLNRNGLVVNQLTLQDIEIQCISTPGHSPDSTCYQIEDVLVTGDILFTANSGIAGIVGWSFEELQQSVVSIQQYLQQQGSIHSIVSGHGRLIDKSISLKMIQNLIKSFNELSDIKIIDSKRKERLIDLSNILLQKSEVMFAALGGRLHRIEYYLNELEEEAAAETIGQLIDFNAIDKYIEDFGRFARECKSMNKSGYAFFIKGIDFVNRLKKIFQAEILNEIIDPYFLRICERLINSYLRVAGGLAFKSPPLFNPVDLVNDMVQYVRNQKKDYETIPDNLEDEQYFTYILIQRFSYKPLIEYTPEITVLDRLTLDNPAVYTDREALEDILYSIFEYYAGKKLSQITITLDYQAPAIRISITPDGQIEFPAETIEFYNLLVDDTGVDISAQGNTVLFSLSNVLSQSSHLDRVSELSL